MVARVLVIGGYGNFGSRIASSLAADEAVQMLVAGRTPARAKTFAAGLKGAHAPEAHALDINGDVAAGLARIRPDIVVDATGPFQGRDHRVAAACIEAGCHYLDIADGRDFVAGIGALDAAARAQGVLVVSGASSVPCLTAAVVDHYLPAFARLESIDAGITAAQQTNRGLATAEGALSYIGKPFTRLSGGVPATVHGWQEMHRIDYPELGNRLFGACDVPDLALFPTRYPSLGELRFAAGHETAPVHLGLWALSWLVRAGLLRNPARHAAALLRLAARMDRFGSGRSGFHMILSGQDRAGRAIEKRFFLVARFGHGPFIPCAPAVILAARLARGEIARRGAMPCLDLISLADYLRPLAAFDIRIHADPVEG